LTLVSTLIGLGTSLDVMARPGGAGLAERAGVAALREISRLDRVLSRWREDSELAALNRARRSRVSAELYAVVEMAEYWRHETGGAFSGRLGAVPGAPGAGQRAAAKAAEAAILRLDPAGREIDRPEAIRFDLDGVAKGYILDRALAAALRAAPEASGLLIDLGGDIRVWSEEGRGGAWRLGVADPAQPFDNARPLQTIDLRQGALAYSGLRARDGGASHIVDPRCGAPVRALTGAAVVAPTAAQADALATAVAVMEPEAGLSLLGRWPEVSGMLVAADGRMLTSANWSGTRLTAATTTAAFGVWPAGFGLSITVEIPDKGGANYERPYLAAWITDAQKQVVKTLLVLGPEPRWRESNYIFWRRVERMDMAAVARVARTTRAPGRYEVMWDGRADDGRPAPRGAYTLNVEASREHGGHSFVALPLALGGGRASFQSDPAQELGAVTAWYGPAR
jgi:FAD:protein FMN transferase